jgi:phosphoenolpyruvate carboxykinase (ATP)
MLTKDELILQLNNEGLKNTNDVCYNLDTPALYEYAIIIKEVLLFNFGLLVEIIGKGTGRSQNDKFIPNKIKKGQNNGNK